MGSELGLTARVMVSLVVAPVPLEDRKVLLAALDVRVLACSGLGVSVSVQIRVRARARARVKIRVRARVRIWVGVRRRLTERVDRVGLELIELLGAQPRLARHREGLRVCARAALADRALPG